MDVKHLVAGLPEPHDPVAIMIAEQLLECRHRLDQAEPADCAAVRKELGRAGMRQATVDALRETGKDMRAEEFVLALAGHLEKYGV